MTDDPRTLAMARRCQLLTGSYADATRSCECIGPARCRLSPADRAALAAAPRVVEARDRNLAEFRAAEEPA